MLITPRTRVGELLETYPQLEPILTELAPAFSRLKNPVLRKTVGRVATLQQAAALGNIPVTLIINTLRAQVDQELFSEAETGEWINFSEPEWFREAKVAVTLDATPLINKGENPMQEVFSHLERTGAGEVFMLSTPFVPAPIIELIHKKGFPHYCMQHSPEMWHTYFFKGGAGA